MGRLRGGGWTASGCSGARTCSQAWKPTRRAFFAAKRFTSGDEGLRYPSGQRRQSSPSFSRNASKTAKSRSAFVVGVENENFLNINSKALYFALLTAA